MLQHHAKHGLQVEYYSTPCRHFVRRHLVSMNHMQFTEAQKRAHANLPAVIAGGFNMIFCDAARRLQGNSFAGTFTGMSAGSWYTVTLYFQEARAPR